MLKFVYVEILLQLHTYIYYGINLCRIYKDKYLTVHKISTRARKKFRQELTWLDSGCHLCRNFRQPQIRLLHTYFYPTWTALDGWVQSYPTPGPTTSKYLFLAGPVPSALTFSQLIIFFRSETEHLSTYFNANDVSTLLICWFLSLYYCMFFFYVTSHLTCAASFLLHYTPRMVLTTLEEP